MKLITFSWSGPNSTHNFLKYRVFKKNEPIKNRYISKSNYRLEMIHIQLESELLKFVDSVPLFSVRYKLRPHDKS